MKSLIVLLALFSGLLSVNLRAQDTLSMQQSAVWNHDTAVFNDVISVTVSVLNPMVVASYTGDVVVYVALSGAGILDTVIITQAGSVNMSPGDSINTPMNWPVDPTKYVPGNNITVIWPANNSGSVQARDSLVLNTFIDTSLSISIIAPVRFTVYPNPSSDYVYLKLDNPQSYQTVSILDMSGKEVYRSTNISDQINVSHLSSGLYTIKLVGEGARAGTGQLMIRKQ